ncbi:Mitochondrial distribution and morphology protein 31 [Alternaria arborescens]|uniref:Mitochondrial distribution and morphology protein 31 n=1 Tax=Alternaria arborescens TaxID=156630 RepID=A0A4Q4SIA4_9PLEO|nr:Mitochondrial distribution and morphology protein 31 [Alternaria arborescens]RYO22731.1 Mitochondrial distribution and morphology protein 31 [Alternaria arborescens]RYO69779.1 Mitochondrial distribution and morphology protein 31 [Alternaria arborescens]
MNKNVGTLGFLWRAVAGQPLVHARVLSREARGIWAQSQSTSSGGIQKRAIASNCRVFGLSTTTSLPSIARSQYPGQAPTCLLRASSPRTAHLQQSVTSTVLSAWSRNASSKASRALRKSRGSDRRNKSSATNGSTKDKQGPTGQAPQAQLSPQPNSSSKASKTPPKPKPEAASAAKPLLDRLPHHLPHIYRPSKAELLEAASGFWSRIKIHFKWLTIRSTRPFNADEIYALFSWIIAAHFLWIVLGTTTFFMLTIFLVNTAFSQETIAKFIGNYLTKSSGIKVVFETAVVPKWGDGVISFRNVFVSRRPGQGKGKVSKGSQTEMAAAAATITHQDKDGQDGVEEKVEPEEDTNYTQFDISIDTVNVTLSFSKWFNGKGLLEDVEIKGIRGVVDRTSVKTIEGVDPRSYKHEHNPGDFELESFKMEDLLVTIYQPNDFRPFSVSIFSCDLPQLRKQWLFYDFLSANMMSGSFDNSLFTIHPRQTHNRTGTQLSSGRDSEDGKAWKKHSRIRIDGLNIDHLNRGFEGPFSWIHEGNVDIVADVMFPSDDDDSIAKVMSDMYDRVEATVIQQRKHHFSDHAVHGFDEHHEDKSNLDEGTEEDKRYMIMDMRVHLNDVRAAVPIFTRDISYVNNALVRPIVAYMNSSRTFIPVNCRVVKRVSEFDGSWTLYDSGLMEEVSKEMYDAFARDVLEDRTTRKRRIKKVGIWTLQLAAQALFLGLAGNIA